MSLKNKRGLPNRFYIDDDTYVSDLLAFVSSSTILKTLVSSVHILDFFTKSPDLYENVFPPEWREWFALHDLHSLVEFLLHGQVQERCDGVHTSSWQGECPPPETLLHYLAKIRTLGIDRDHPNDPKAEVEVSRQLAVGMRPKKIHEVGHFASYVQNLTKDLTDIHGTRISHLVDFGAGQGYLGRFLASEPSNMHVVAVEGRASNLEVAQAMDVIVKLAPKSGILRDKKQYRSARAAAKKEGRSLSPAYRATRVKGKPSGFDSPPRTVGTSSRRIETTPIAQALEGKGSVQHVEHHFQDGDLDDVVKKVERQLTLADLSNAGRTEPRSVECQHSSNLAASIEQQARLDHAIEPSLLVISLHSCGNLSHHALRSLVMNPTVKGIAVVGCCYNLLTEKFGPPSYKSEYLRPEASSVEEGDARSGDCHGFPMSSRLSTYFGKQAPGLSFNITARMMAVQAPTNWTRNEADSFFTRHYFRALLQRIFVDHGIVEPPIADQKDQEHEDVVAGRSPAGGGGSLQPIVVGSLSKSAYKDFPTYGRAALARVQKSNKLSAERLSQLNAIADEDLEQYSREHEGRRKDIGIVWTLMALSATLVEATIVVDRWLWLKEQNEVEGCWVEAVFDYRRSPRNLVVVGIKRGGGG
ncbi:MAG: hypothetical protein Q9159_000203 [Coniocarpon cinnabarinum]